MELHEQLLTCLEEGLLISATYEKDKILYYCFLAKASTLKFLHINCLHSDNEVVDICLDSAVDINNLPITKLDFFCMPVGVLLSDLIDANSSMKRLGKGFLLKSEEYVKDLKQLIVKIKLNYKEYLEDNLIADNFSLENQNFLDTFLLKMYPIIKHPTKETIQNYKDKIINEYFLDNFTNVENNNIDQQSTIDALSILKVPDRNFDVTDPEYICTVRRQWFNIIKTHKLDFLNELYSVDKSKLDEEELKEFDSEINILNEEMENDINNELQNKNTIEEIISYWPQLIQPLPTFVYVKN